MKILLFITTLLLYNFGFAHLCHDPFRPQDRLHVLPESELIKIEDKGEFRVYVENNFSSTLRDVQLCVNSPAFDVNVEPAMLKELSPGERTFFVVGLNLKEGFKTANYPLSINVRASSAELTPSIERIQISAEKKTREDLPEILQEQPSVPSVPSVKDAELEKKVTKPSEIPQIKEQPPEIPQIKEQEIKEPVEISVKVEKIPFWRKTYFYAILILLLLVIILWRKSR